MCNHLCFGQPSANLRPTPSAASAGRCFRNGSLAKCADWWASWAGPRTLGRTQWARPIGPGSKGPEPLAPQTGRAYWRRPDEHTPWAQPIVLGPVSPTHWAEPILLGSLGADPMGLAHWAGPNGPDPFGPDPLSRTQWAHWGVPIGLGNDHSLPWYLQLPMLHPWATRRGMGHRTRPWDTGQEN